MSDPQTENALFDQVTGGFSSRTQTYMLRHEEATELLSNGWGQGVELNTPNGDGTFTSRFTWRGKEFICVSANLITALPR